MCIFVIWLTVGSCSHVMNLEMCCVVDLSEGSREFPDNTGMYHSSLTTQVCTTQSVVSHAHCVSIAVCGPESRTISSIHLLAV